MQENVFLIYDVITSGMKTSLFSVNGKLRNTAFRPLPLYLKGDRAEQEAETWLKSMLETTKEVLEQQDYHVAAISFSAMSQVCLCLDEKGAPLGPAYTWSDSRAKEVEDPLEHTYSQEEILNLTGFKNTPVSSIRKLHWIKEKRPDIYDKVKVMIQCKDYLVYYLTGKIFTDFTDASSTGALDIQNGKWSQEILGCLGIQEDKMPNLAASNMVVGNVTPKAAKELGIEAGIPVVMGAGDVPCSAVGAGCVHAGDVYLSLGSSSWMAVCTDRPRMDSQGLFTVMPHAVPEKYLSFINYQTAGVVFKWLKNAVFQYDPEGTKEVLPFANVYPYTLMEEQVEKSGLGAGGLLFLPYILPGNSSHQESYARGAFIGLNWTHTREDMMRAALEGVTFEWKRFLNGILGGKRPEMITITGIASHEELWLQMIADVLGIPVRNTELYDTPDSIGAAVLAGQAIGLYRDFDEADQFRSYDRVFFPNAEAHERYQTLYKIYETAFSQITDVLKSLEKWRLEDGPNRI